MIFKQETDVRHCANHHLGPLGSAVVPESFNFTKVLPPPPYHAGINV
jgi:hypothetical protein